MEKQQKKKFHCVISMLILSFNLRKEMKRELSVFNPHPTNRGPIGPQVIISIYHNSHGRTIFFEISTICLHVLAALNANVTFRFQRTV